MLDARQRHAFEYFLCETNSANGLVVDKTKPDALASIAAHARKKSNTLAKSRAASHLLSQVRAYAPAVRSI